VGAADNTTQLCATLKAAMAPGRARLLAPDNTVDSVTTVLSDWSTALLAAAPQASDDQFATALTQLATELDSVKANVTTPQDVENWTTLMTAPNISAALHTFDSYCPAR
jgi:hypothetical protein